MTYNRGLYVKSSTTRQHIYADLDITVKGGGGGKGGNDSAAGYPGYPGATVTGTLTVNLNESLVIDIGLGGEQGYGGSGVRGGYAGTSSNGFNGGRGGRSGPAGTSGSGGAGGAATSIKYNGELFIVAAGGGGGGGGGNGPPGVATSGGYTDTPVGGQGPDKGGDGGGGGGGGGGYPYGGAAGPLRGGDSGAYSGGTGQSLIPSGFANSTSSSMNYASGPNGITEFKYLSVTGKPYFQGGTVTYGETFIDFYGQEVRYITHTFNTSGRLVGLGPAVPAQVDWQQLIEGKVKVGPDWKNISNIYRNVDGQWKKVYPSSGLVERSTPGQSYTFVVPPGIYSVNLHMISGGGGGAGCQDNEEPVWTGSGGGSGNLVNTTVNVTPGQTIRYYVGRGGNGGGVGSGGNSGESTSFGTTTAPGGGGGGIGSGTGGTGTNPGTNGTYVNDDRDGWNQSGGAGGAAVEGYASGGTGGSYSEDGEYGTAGTSGTSGFIRITWG